jgi:hypothetical protein
MSATFACPHCGVSYPVKPVLIGRTVRCTTCKQAFRLREDGIADKVVADVPPPQPTAPAPAFGVVPPPTPAPQPAAAPAFVVVPPAAPAPTPARPATATSGRIETSRIKGRELNEQQREARRTLAANLTTAATEALRAESVKREEAHEKKKVSDRLAKAAKAARPTGKDGQVGDIGPAVLTDTGGKEHRNNLVWMGGCLGFLVLVGLIVWLSRMTSAEERALTTYTAEVPKERSRYGERLVAIQERALLRNAPPLVDTGSLHVHASRRVKIGLAKKALEDVKGMKFLGTPPVWAKAELAGSVRSQWNPRFDTRSMVEKLNANERLVVDEATVKKGFLDAGLDAEAFDLYMTLVRGRPTPDHVATVERIQNGEVPDAIEIAAFNGSHGLLLVERGREYRTKPVSYEGRLIRFIGSGWDDTWKILDLKTQAEDDDLTP